VTSLQLTVDSAVATVDVPARVEPGRLPASEEAIRLALRLRDARSMDGGRLLIFIPVSASGSVAPLVEDVVSGLMGLNEGPALVMDLRVSATRRGDATASMGRVHPFIGHADTLSHAASPEFAALLAHARARYPYVLCVAEPLSSVETLIAAGLCDGVVLSVSPGRTTRADVQRAAEQLRGAHATVIGFVVDRRVAEKGA
jgi:hypothetical protein